VRVLILTFGTRGDVQPYVALAAGLLAAGHDAVVGTADGFRDLMMGTDVPVLPVGNEMLALLQAGMPTMAGPADAPRLIRQMTAAMRSGLLEQWEAARTFGPDLVVYHPKMLGGLHIAERLQVPAVVSLPLPFFTPTTAYPIPFIGRWPLGGAANRWSYQFNRFTAVAYGGMINSFRRRTLGLPALSRWTDYLRFPDGGPVPVLYGYSSTVVPAPADYPPHAHVTGYWFTPASTGWDPAPPLREFLAAGEPPVYIGFGSMGFGKHAAARGRIVVEAVRAAGVRAVVATGWGGLEVHDSSPDVHVVGDVPHDSLFPQTIAVVHHGGAGTTAAGLRAGRPTLICPVLGDQGFWGERIRQLQAGPAPLPVGQLSVERLATRLRHLVNDATYRREAQRLGRSLRREDGVGTAVAVLEQLATNRRDSP
jgi:sterol 3beta-glucosyltransferase